MGSPKTVDRNAMTFVPIGWNVVLWGVKNLARAGQGIDEDGKRSSLANPMRRKRHKIQKQLQKARASCIRSRARGYQRKRRTRPRNKWPNFRRDTRMRFIHDAVDPHVTLCQVMGRYGL